MSTIAVLLLLAAQGPPDAAPTTEAVPVAAYDFSAPVVDLAELLPDDVERELSSRLRAHLDQTGVAVGVVVLDQLGDQSIMEAGHAASARLLEGFAKGARHVAIVVAPNERRLRVEIGAGLEGGFGDGRGEPLVNQALHTFQRGDGATAVVELANGVMQQTLHPPMSPTTRAVLVSLAAGAAVGVLGLLIVRRRRRT